MALLSNQILGDPLLGGAGNLMLPACPDLLTLQQAVITTDAAGGTVYTWTNATTIASKVPCNLQNVSPREMETFARRGIRVSNKAFTPMDLNAQLGQRIYIQSAPTVFYVVTFISDMGGEHSAFKIYVNLVE